MSKIFPCCIANAAGCACDCGQTDADVLLRELKAANKRADKLAALLRDVQYELRHRIGAAPNAVWQRIARDIDAALAGDGAGKEGT